MTEIKNGKVVFSKEILNYFENLKTEENSKWINKYFDVLLDSSNFNTEKFNIHHIRPCFTFKDKEHKNRKQTEIVADKFNGNLIKLSIYNHIKAHYFLWKIFNNWDSRHSVQHMCGLKTNLDVLSEDELDEIAKFKEDCAKKNKTREEHLEDLRKYRKEHKDERKQYKKKYNQENKDKKSKWDANYRKKHIDNIIKYKEENRDRLNEQAKAYYSQKCFDPKENDICTLRALQKRKRKNIEKYKDIIPNDCIFKTEEEYLQKQKELDDKEKEKIKFEEKYGKNQCFDPKEIEICILRTLQNRKKKYSEKYKDINPRDCIIKSEEEYLQKKLECEKHESEKKKAQREHLLQYKKDYYQKNKEQCSENNKKNYERNKDKYQERKNEYAKIHKKEISAYKREFNARLCYDPKENNYCTLSQLYGRKFRNKEKYKDVIPKDCVVKDEE